MYFVLVEYDCVSCIFIYIYISVAVVINTQYLPRYIGMYEFDYSTYCIGIKYWVPFKTHLQTEKLI